jgi:hypothetical protein
VFTAGYNALRTQFRITYDGDLWGQAMGWLFAIADYLWHTSPEDIPASWQFRHSPVCNGDNPDNYELSTIGYMIVNGEITDEDVLTFGKTLGRYANVLRLAGRDY